MRGLAVLIMIEAHLVDSWTRVPDRESREFGWAMILGGFGAPLFLFLAGVAVALSAGSKVRRTGDPSAASRAVARRGLEIFGLAFLFRLQALALGWGHPRTLLRVDILNIMGPSIMAAAAIWGACRTTRARYAAMAAAALAMTLLTPVVRSAAWPGVIPDPIEGYFRPVAGITSFAFFPWAGFVFAGGVLGIALDGARTGAAEARVNRWLLLTGTGLALGAFAASYLPTPYARSDFWTSSPSFFLLRTGIMTAAVPLAYAWERRPWGSGKWSPVQQLGRTSLFIYWIHVELVYGLISLPLHRSLGFATAWIALAAFAVGMLGVSLLKDRAVSRWKHRRQIAPASA